MDTQTLSEGRKGTSRNIDNSPTDGKTRESMTDLEKILSEINDYAGFVRFIALLANDFVENNERKTIL